MKDGLKLLENYHSLKDSKSCSYLDPMEELEEIAGLSELGNGIVEFLLSAEDIEFISDERAGDL